MPLQKQVNIAIALGVAGDFASQNPYHTLLAGRAQYRVGATPVLIGTFAEVDTTTGLAVNAVSGTKPFGFVGRQSNNAIITQWMGSSSMQLQPGYAITLYDGGDFYIQIAAATVTGQNVFASTTDGSIATATGDTLAGHVLTKFKVAIGAGANELATITSA